MSLNILVLEPFGGGSHASFYRGWQKYSAHTFTILELPAFHWKWRSRHGSLSLALRANELAQQGQRFDLLFCSDMLNLPEWRGCACEHLRALPAILYFHENQFTYPVSDGQARDYHFAYSNILSALAADQVWFNSHFHRDEFATAAKQWLRRMPDFRHSELFERAIEHSQVRYPGIDPLEDFEGQELDDPKTCRSSCPTIGWVARWEHDKRPDRFVAAIEKLIEGAVDFQLILLGQQFANRVPSLERLLQVAGDRVLHWGYAKSKSEYWQWLRCMDVVVSTADHEFFGIAVLEAMRAGAFPVLPQRLSYPEILQLERYPDRLDYFFQNDHELVSRLRNACSSTGNLQRALPNLSHFEWSSLATQYDQECALICYAGP